MKENSSARLKTEESVEKDERMELTFESEVVKQRRMNLKKMTERQRNQNRM